MESETKKLGLCRETHASRRRVTPAPRAQAQRTQKTRASRSQPSLPTFSVKCSAFDVRCFPRTHDKRIARKRLPVRPLFSLCAPVKSFLVPVPRAVRHFPNSTSSFLRAFALIPTFRVPRSEFRVLPVASPSHLRNLLCFNASRTQSRPVAEGEEPLRFRPSTFNVRRSMFDVRCSMFPALDFGL
jgi:hypothetical protein